MIFEIATADLKYIFAALKSVLRINEQHKMQEYIKFTCVDGRISACALDGFRLYSVTVPIICDDVSAFEFLMKPFALPKTAFDSILCELSETEIAFEFGERKFISRLGKGEFLDVNAVIPKTDIVTRIGFNPDFLADAARTMKDSTRTPIVMEIRSPLEPVIMYPRGNRENFRMVLPMRMKMEDLSR